MGGPPLLQIAVAALAAIAVVAFSRATYRVLQSSGINRASRITTGVIGGLLVGAALYFTFTDMIGTLVGVALDAAWLIYRRKSTPKADFIVRDDVLLDEAVSPELGADLEDFASQISGGARVSEGHFEVPDLPPMPGAPEAPSEVSEMPDSIRPSR